jgi:hypothetical protein
MESGCRNRHEGEGGMSRDCPLCGSHDAIHTNAKRCIRCSDAIEKIRENAGRQVREAVRLGELLRQRDCICVDCGKQAQAYDHRDYFQPMVVEPVCNGCNFRRPSPTMLWSIEHIELYCPKWCLDNLELLERGAWMQGIWRRRLTAEVAA